MATKKITELPLIQTISGSFSVVPIVIGNSAGNGTTDQITIENFSKFVTQYSAHTGSAGNTFTGPQIISSSLSVTGNGTIGGNLAVAGRITAEEFYTEITTASVIYASGSTKFGDDTGDKHEFTGSINVTGSIIYNGVILTNIDANTIQRLQQTTASLNTFTSSQADRNLVLSTVTGSINQATASIQFQTASLLQFTASQDSRNFTLSQVTGSFNYFYQSTASLQAFTASQADRNLVLSTVTGSINQATQSLQIFTASQADRNLVLSTVTGSINQFTASQDARNFIISQYTSSTDAHIVGISAFTSSILAQNTGVASVTASLNQFTASQDSRNLTLSTVTGSLIGITNGLMAFTAALDNTYATDAQLYQLYQATRSLELHSGSMIGVTNGLMAYTASNSTLNTGLRGEIDGIEAYTASLKGQAIVSSSTQVQNYNVFALNSNLYTSTGSLIGITNGLMAFTAALDSTYATDAQLYQLYQATRSIELTTGSLIGITNGLMAFTAALDSTYATDAQLYQLYAETASIKAEIAGIEAYTASLKGQAIVSSSTQIQNYDVFALNSNLYNGTGSIKAEIAGIEAYTASLKGQAIVSSSTQVQNYDVFALNSNLYNGTGSIKAEVGGIEAYTASLKAASIVSSSQQVQNYFTFAKTGSANTFYGTQTITGSLNVGVGTSDNTAGDLLVDTSNKTVYIGRQSSTSGDNTIFAVRNRLNTLNAIYADPGGNGKVEVTGSFEVTRGVKLGTTTGNVEVIGNLVMTTAGNGIDFSATSNGSGTMTSELLNDYEEGTFTPTMEGSTTAGTGTYVRQIGVYTKIGNLVTCNVWLQWSAHSGTGDIILAGFPFTSIGTTNYRASGTFGWVENLTLSANNIVSMAMSPSSTTAVGDSVPSWWRSATSVAMDTSANLHYSITYQTA